MPHPDTPDTPRQRRWRRVIPTLRERYGISRQTAWRWLQNSDLQFPETRFFAGSTFIDLDDLDRWDDSRPVVTPAPTTPEDYLQPGPKAATGAATARRKRRVDDSGEAA